MGDIILGVLVVIAYCLPGIFLYVAAKALGDIMRSDDEE